MEMMLDKKQTQAIFLFEFKMGHKAMETAHNINSASGPGTASEHTTQGGSRSFEKETSALKMRRFSGWPLEADNNWEDHQSWFFYNDMRSCPRTQHQPFYSRLALKPTGKVKKLGEWVPHELTANQKNISFWSLYSLILHNNNEPFLNWIVMCNEK